MATAGTVAINFVASIHDFLTGTKRVREDAARTQKELAKSGKEAGFFKNLKGIFGEESTIGMLGKAARGAGAVAGVTALVGTVASAVDKFGELRAAASITGESISDTFARSIAAGQGFVEKFAGWADSFGSLISGKQSIKDLEAFAKAQTDATQQIAALQKIGAGERVRSRSIGLDGADLAGENVRNKLNETLKTIRETASAASTMGGVWAMNAKAAADYAEAQARVNAASELNLIQLREEHRAAEVGARVWERQANAARDVADAIQEEIDAGRMSADQLEDQRLKRQGVNKETLESIKALRDERDAVRRAAIERENVAAREDAIADAQEQQREERRSRLESLTASAFSENSLNLAGAAVRGSSEAASALARFAADRVGDNDKARAQRALDIAKQQLDRMERIEQLIRATVAKEMAGV